MWQKFVIATLVFYILALLQNSFFSYFNLFGATLNLVFIFFFTLVFFSVQGGPRPKGYPGWEVIFYAITAGFFLDIFTYTYLGPSVILLVVLSFLLKKIQLLLKNKDDKHPLAYFMPLFIIFLLAYNTLLSLYLHFIDPNKIALSFGMQTVFMLIYNLIIASIFFIFYKKFIGESIDK